MNDINLLFESGAFKVAPAEKPFFYTSGLIGPYFINTHFLCGGEQTANQVLTIIDTECLNSGFQQRLIQHLEEIYNSNAIYKSSIDAAANLIKNEIGLTGFAYVSGGERRDWFFSPLVAKLLDKPLLWIYKDGTVLDSNGREHKDLKGEKAINVADLLTVGSSYERAWVPELSKRNCNLAYSLNIVDRLQGGKDILLKLGLERVLSIFKIDNDFIQAAFSRNLIDKNQFKLLVEYKNDPHQAMRDFIISNPTFIENAKFSSDSKTKARLELMLSQNPYNI